MRIFNRCLKKEGCGYIKDMETTDILLGVYRDILPVTYHLDVDEVGKIISDLEFLAEKIIQEDECELNLTYIETNSIIPLRDRYLDAQKRFDEFLIEQYDFYNFVIVFYL